MIKAANAQNQEILFTLKGVEYSVPHVIENRFIIGPQIEIGNFGVIF